MKQNPFFIIALVICTLFSSTTQSASLESKHKFTASDDNVKCSGVPGSSPNDWNVVCDKIKNTLSSISSPTTTVVFDGGIAPPANCQNVQVPSFALPDYSSYQSHFGTPFPNATSASPEIQTSLGYYSAVSFTYTTPTVSVGSDLTAFNFEAASGYYGEPVISMVTISECPGDFGGTNSVVNDNCSKRLNVGSGQIRTYPTDSTHSNAPYFCQLEEGKEYFLNIIHTEFPFSQSPHCNVVINNGCAVLAGQGF